MRIECDGCRIGTAGCGDCFVAALLAQPAPAPAIPAAGRRAAAHRSRSGSPRAAALAGTVAGALPTPRDDAQPQVEGQGWHVLRPDELDDETQNAVRALLTAGLVSRTAPTGESGPWGRLVDRDAPVPTVADGLGPHERTEPDASPPNSAGSPPVSSRGVPSLGDDWPGDDAAAVDARWAG